MPDAPSGFPQDFCREVEAAFQRALLGGATAMGQVVGGYDKLTLGVYQKWLDKKKLSEREEELFSQLQAQYLALGSSSWTFLVAHRDRLDKPVQDLLVSIGKLQEELKQIL